MERLQVGDIICWYDDDSGHTVLVYSIEYDENNNPVNAIIREASSNYEKETTKITKGLSYEELDNEKNNISDSLAKQ